MKRVDLTNSELIVFAAIKAAARNGEPCPSNMDLAALLDCSSIATPCRALKGLEAKGFVTVERYQHSRQVFIGGTDLATAEPRHKTVHWRKRKRFTRHELQDRIADLASEGLSLAAIARELGFSVVHVRNVWTDIKRQLGWQAV